MKKLFIGWTVAIISLSSLAYLQVSADTDDKVKSNPVVIPISSIQLCVKESGAAFVVGQGFKKADCKSNDKFFLLTTSTGSTGATGAIGPIGPQ